MPEEPAIHRFPLLRLPYLCIEAIILNSDVCSLIHFSLVSKRTNRLVEYSKSPVSSIKMFFDQDPTIIFLPMKSTFKIGRSAYYLERLMKLFKCSVDYLDINADYLSDFIDASFIFNKVKKLAISGKKEVENDKLKYLVERFEVSEAFIVMCPVSNSFHCNPKLFDAKTLMLMKGKSAGWITGNYLSQLGNIRILHIDFPQFGMEDFVEFITGWFQSVEKTNLKSFITSFENPFPLEDLVLDHLQPMPWDPKRRPAGVFFQNMNVISDLSQGLDILRSDGQLATILAEANRVLFHVWSQREMRGLPYE